MGVRKCTVFWGLRTLWFLFLQMRNSSIPLLYVLASKSGMLLHHTFKLEITYILSLKLSCLVHLYDKTRYAKPKGQWVQMRCQTLNIWWKKHEILPSTSWAVNRCLGSGSSILFTRSFALSETLGHGSLLKSMTQRIIACATPCSVSAEEFKYQIMDGYHLQYQ